MRSDAGRLFAVSRFNSLKRYASKTIDHADTDIISVERTLSLAAVMMVSVHFHHLNIRTVH
jgi:hypothetical protein